MTKKEKKAIEDLANVLMEVIAGMAHPFGITYCEELISKLDKIKEEIK